MASCTDLTKLATTMGSRPITKATPVPISTSKKLVEPFYRLKNRANLFRRKHYSSHLDISENCSILPDTHNRFSDKKKTFDNVNHVNNNAILKRSNSMICPQQRLQSFLKATNITNNNNNNNNYRNSICVELTDTQMDESSTDDFHHVKSLSHYSWNKNMRSTMSNIKEQDVYPSQESLDENKNETASLLPTNNIKETSVEVSASPQLAKNMIEVEGKQSLVPTVISSSLTLPSQNNNESILSCRQSSSNRDFHEEPFYDCKQDMICFKSSQNNDMTTSKLSACTMTGKSLNNLDESLTIMSAEDKSVQTIVLDSKIISSSMARNDSSTSLSSSTTSIQTDSLENKPKSPKVSKLSEPSKNSTDQRLIESYYKSPHIYERLLSDDACIYWVNYLGSTAIKISNDDTPAIPTRAINRLKQSTKYARILPIIGLSISPRGVEFLKHSKDRVTICFHDIKSIHCACQDQDLRYFAYVTHEQRATHGVSSVSTTVDHKQKPPLSSSSSFISKTTDYHNYCHVFVVKNEAMSTEILLTFGQAFDIAYRIHRRPNSKPIYTDESRQNINVSHFTARPNQIMISSINSPAASSSSSSSHDERRNFL